MFIVHVTEQKQGLSDGKGVEELVTKTVYDEP